MKSFFFLLLILNLLTGCSSKTEWDNGAQAKNSFNEEASAQNEEAMRVQLPGPNPDRMPASSR